MEPPEYLPSFPRMPPKPARMIARLDLKELDPYIDKVILNN